jgi:diguanylate cyclase (GGDEF)-like protein
MNENAMSLMSQARSHRQVVGFSFKLLVGLIRVVMVAAIMLANSLVLFGVDITSLERDLQRASGKERINILLKLAEAYMYRSPDKVVQYAQQACDAAAALSSPRDSANAFLTRATGYFQLGDLNKALESYQQSLTAAERLSDHVIIGGCLNGIAAVNLKRGQIDVALDYFSRSIEHLKQTPVNTKLAGAYSNVALIYYAKGNYNQALEFMFQALRLYETAGDAGGQGVILNALGNVYSKLADTARARENFEKALEIARKTGNKQLIVGCLVNIGEIHSKQRDWDRARECLDRALPVARELGSRDFISVCLNNIGDVMREKGKTEEALRYYLESLKIFETMNARPRMAVSYLNIGRLYLKTGNPAEAERYLLKAFDLARDVQERSIQKDAAEVLNALYAQQGNFRRAYEFQRAYSEITEQIFSKENYEKITTLQTAYQAEKQGQEIELLKKQSEIKELEVKRQRLWLGLIATGLVLLACLAFVLFNRYQLKAKTTAELEAAYGRMSQLAQHDELTGLYNRRSANECIEIEMVRMGRTNRPFSLILLDVDDFKFINDTYGHDCGDLVLKSLADLLRSQVRAADVAARWGGDEFIVILPETSHEGAVILAEKLQAAVDALRLRYDSREVLFTVTLGVSFYDKLGAPSECLRSADEALYTGKRAGKNKVVSAHAS